MLCLLCYDAIIVLQHSGGTYCLHVQTCSSSNIRVVDSRFGVFLCCKFFGVECGIRNDRNVCESLL